MQRTKRRHSASIALGVVAILLIVISIGDEIAGRMYLNHLCRTEAGIKVHATVELAAEYWDKGGRPIFFNKQGYPERDVWLREIDESVGERERYSRALAIDRATNVIKHRPSQKVLAEVTTFRHWGGWVKRSFTLHNTATSCQFIRDPGFSQSLYGQLFRPPTSLK